MLNISLKILVTDNAKNNNYVLEINLKIKSEIYFKL